MRVIQFKGDDGERHVGLVEAEGDHARTISGISTLYDVALRALATGERLSALISRSATGPRVDYAELLYRGQVLAPGTTPTHVLWLRTELCSPMKTVFDNPSVTSAVRVRESR